LSSTSGTKTIYGKLKDADGNISTIKSNTIDYIESLTIISTNNRMRWSTYENLDYYTNLHKSVGVVVNKMTIDYNDNNRTIYDTKGNSVGTSIGITNQPSTWEINIS